MKEDTLNAEYSIEQDLKQGMDSDVEYDMKQAWRKIWKGNLFDK